MKATTSHWELSAAGKVLTSTVTEFRPNGPVIRSQTTFSRVSGSSDFSGQWRDTSYLQEHADMTLRLDRQALHVGYPSAGQYIDAALDGTDTPMRGPHAVQGVTYAVQRVGNRELAFLTKRSGKILTQDALELSNDGRTIIDSWWNPDRPSNKGTLVYEKQ
jgi:hypothetical protein